MTAGGARLAEGQAELWRGVAADPAWSTRWMLELLGKEFRLARALQPRLGGATRNTRTPERIETPTQPQCCNGTAPARHPGPRRAAVLGATGHIGNAVVRELLSRGWDVTAVSRRAEPPANLAGLPVKFVRGGEHDQAGAFAAWIAGHDLVVDAAAPYPIDLFPKEEGGRKSLLDRVEARTRTLLTALRRHGARLVYVGSFVTTPRSGDRLEGARSRALRRIHPYFAVKQLIARRINAETQAGLESIIVNPTVCIGPWDVKPREYCLIPQLLCGEVPGLVRHAVNVIDVRDVAFAVGAAVDAGRYGEEIPLSGHNVSIDTLVERICRVAGGATPPRIRLPVAAALCGTLITEALLKPTRLSSPSPALATMLVAESYWTSPGPAQRSLGAHPRPLSGTLADAVDWYRQLGYC